MQDTRLFEIFQSTKETICKYDYYIHTSKRILHLTNTEDKTLHLGIIKINAKEKNLCQCNSFMTTYRKDKNSDAFYRDLEHCYEINKIVREDKMTKQAEVIYQSEQAVLREKQGIEKMLISRGVEPEEKLVRYIMKLNVSFGEYHTLDMVSDTEQLMKKCKGKRDEALVKDFIDLWEKRIDGI